MSHGYQIAGWITFSLGFLLGLVYALPAEPDIFMFGTGCVLCSAGLIFLRQHPSARLKKGERDDVADEAARQSGDPSAADYVFHAPTSLTHLLWFVEQIRPEDSPAEMQSKIEKIQFYQVAPMVKYRHKLQEELGMEHFARVYSLFASGERHLNRAWSAVVDGYPDEALQSLTTSRENFAACRDALKNTIE